MKLKDEGQCKRDVSKILTSFGLLYSKSLFVQRYSEYVSFTISEGYLLAFINVGFSLDKPSIDTGGGPSGMFRKWNV
jgi:hypothetical protein